jgi:hypothetical protein
MKPFTVAALAASAVMALCAPGAGMAQPYDHHDWGDHGPGDRGDHRGPDDRGGPERGGWDLDHRLDWLQTRISRGRDDGSLDRREAWRAQRTLDSIRNDERRMKWRHHGWLNDGDRMALQARLDQLNEQLHWLRHNDERRPW